ncbi:MAG TPA: DUF2721 domain-containing protein [Ktedonosporobacter sp.]|nr:DUF2721 domain-containing protein [Ktedonosporobacter sp.]
MDITEIIRTISLVLAPVVMISCCTLFLNGQLQRYDSLSMRMRAMTQERFEILRDGGNSVTGALETVDGLSELRLREIEAQLPHLLKRHRMIHRATLTIALAILIFFVSMCILALAAMINSTQVAIIALVAFLLGTATILFGVMMMMFELYQSNRAVRYEVLHALSLGKQAPSLTMPHRRLQLRKAVPRKTASLGV